MSSSIWQDHVLLLVLIAFPHADSLQEESLETKRFYKLKKMNKNWKVNQQIHIYYKNMTYISLMPLPN